MIEAVIFDVDGTLVDSVGLHARAWQDAFRHFGQEVSLRQVRDQIGKGGDHLMPVFLSEEQIQRQGEEIEEYRTRIFAERYMELVKPFPRVRDLFEKLRSNNQRIALASSAKGEELQTYKRLADIEDLLDTETSSDDAEESKPEPDIFLAALHRLHDPAPETVLVVGDSPYDAEAAAKAGIGAIGLLSGGFSRKQLGDAGCRALYRDPANLFEEYDRSPLAK